mmetsp:Transcript_7533/g.22076  ORF Transcript_7533/g.22076 Transcript_7533/m.22076 type:complete len:269 (-) Transcript_7533:911-1717(-)
MAAARRRAEVEGAREWAVRWRDAPPSPPSRAPLPLRRVHRILPLLLIEVPTSSTRSTSAARPTTGTTPRYFLTRDPSLEDMTRLRLPEQWRWRRLLLQWAFRPRCTLPAYHLTAASYMLPTLRLARHRTEAHHLPTPAALPRQVTPTARLQHRGIPFHWANGSSSKTTGTTASTTTTEMASLLLPRVGTPGSDRARVPRYSLRTRRCTGESYRRGKGRRRPRNATPRSSMSRWRRRWLAARKAARGVKEEERYSTGACSPRRNRGLGR